MTKTQEIEQFETHMDRMEREAQAQRAALAVEQEKTKQAKVAARSSRHEAIVYSLMVIAAAAVVLGILAAVFFGVRGPSAEQELRQEHIRMCFEKGGTWEPDSGDLRDDDFKAEHCDYPNDGD